MKNFLQKIAAACFVGALSLFSMDANAQAVKLELSNNFATTDLLHLDASLNTNNDLDTYTDGSIGVALTQTKYTILPKGGIQVTYLGTLRGAYIPTDRIVVPVTYRNVVGADYYEFSGDAVMKSDGTLTLRLNGTLLGPSPF